MMLEFLGENEAGAAVEAAITDVTAHKLKSMAVGKTGFSTTEIGDMVAERVSRG
jgi:3-isopropylmalate dehydrogenase